MDEEAPNPTPADEQPSSPKIPPSASSSTIFPPSTEPTSPNLETGPPTETAPPTPKPESVPTNAARSADDADKPMSRKSIHRKTRRRTTKIGGFEESDLSAGLGAEATLKNLWKDWRSLEKANPITKSNPEVVLKAVELNGWALQFAAEHFRDDEKIVMAAVKSNGWALELASEALRDNRRIVMEAVKQNGRVLKFASERLRKDIIIVDAAVKQRGPAWCPQLYERKVWKFEPMKEERVKPKPRGEKQKSRTEVRDL